MKTELSKKAIVFIRWLAYLEGTTLPLLVGIAVPLKYFRHDAKWVQILGPVHGVLLVWFVINVVRISTEERWSWKKITLPLLAGSLIPFGSFLLDYRILQKKLKEKQHI